MDDWLHLLIASSAMASCMRLYECFMIHALVAKPMSISCINHSCSYFVIDLQSSNASMVIILLLLYYTILCIQIFFMEEVMYICTIMHTQKFTIILCSQMGQDLGMDKQSCDRDLSKQN